MNDITESIRKLGPDEFCDCEACEESGEPCQFDCDESLCMGCYETAQAILDEEFDSRIVLHGI